VPLRRRVPQVSILRPGIVPLARRQHQSCHPERTGPRTHQEPQRANELFGVGSGVVSRRICFCSCQPVPQVSILRPRRPPRSMGNTALKAHKKGTKRRARLQSCRRKARSVGHDSNRAEEKYEASGHDFSRADKTQNDEGALAPEGKFGKEEI
jgi:hypothetical protein